MLNEILRKQVFVSILYKGNMQMDPNGRMTILPVTMGCIDHLSVPFPSQQVPIADGEQGSRSKWWETWWRFAKTPAPQVTPHTQGYPRQRWAQLVDGNG